MWVQKIAEAEKWIAAVVITAGVGGCTIRPLPDDVAHISTYEIVRQVRCETRAAIIDSFLGFLTDEDNNRPTTQGWKKVDDASLDIGRRTKARYEKEPASISQFNPAKLSGFAREVVGLMFHVGIAYNYDLKGVVASKFDPEVNLLRPLPLSTPVSLSMKGNFDRERQNERVFTVTDTAGSLVKDVPARYCTKFIAEANVVYPIAGRVGMEKMIQDFVRLTLFGNLSGDGRKDVTAVAGPPTMVDQLEFKTVIGGSATPKVTFIPAGDALGVSNASFELSASRTDTHQLTVGLYLDKEGAAGIGGVRSAVFDGNLITASGGRAARGAAQAVQQFLQLKLFRPTVVIQQ